MSILITIFLMPSIELICIDQVEISQFENLPFALDAENELISHRSPEPHFQIEFDELKGCIYHLGNPALCDSNAQGYYTAHDLLSKPQTIEWWNIIMFAPEFIPAINHILEQLIATSPTGKVFFTSDYQFGPKPKRYKRPITLHRFWQLHQAALLKMNALYQLKAN